MCIKRKKLIFLALLCSMPLYGDSTDIFHKESPARTINDSVSHSFINAIPLTKVTISENPSIENEQYDQYPPCPKNPVCPENVTSLKPTSEEELKCPSICTKTRELGPKNPDGRYTQSTDAVCPTNFVQVASYNMQDEVIYQSNPPSVGPIPIGQWQWHLDNNYRCYPMNNIQIRTLCGKANRTLLEKLNVNEEGVNLGINPKHPAIIDGYAATWVDNDSYAPRKSSECYLWNANLSCSIKASCIIEEMVDRRFYFPYQLYACQPPSGIYATGHKAPISIVCVHRKNVWRPVHPNKIP